MTDKEEPKSWYWTIENGLAVLHEGFNRPISYNKDSLERALKNAKSGRNHYSTQELWLERVEKYEIGLSILLSAQNKQT